MLRTSTPDLPVETPVEGSTEVVEAPTAEAAIEQVHARLGPDARILDARRVLRGGIGGFFSREHVQLHAAPALGSAAGRAGAPLSSSPSTGVPAGTPAPAPSPAPTKVGPQASGLPVPPPVVDDVASSPVDRLLRGAADAPEAVDFATYLRTQLAPDAGRADGLDTPGSPADLRPPSGPRPPDEVSGPTLWPAGSVKAGDDVTRILPPEPTRWAGPVSVAPSFSGSDAWPSSELERPDWAMPTVDRERSEWAMPSVEDERAAPAVPASVPPMTAASPAVVPGAAPGEPRPATDGGPAWSVPALLRLGLPVELVRGLEVAAPNDDLAWTNAVAEAVRPLCRPLPAGPSILVGPDAHLLAEVAEAPAARSRTWLHALGEDRWRHLVLGGERWRQELADEPLAVSWARTDDLPDALRCAAELGLVLGFGPLRNGLGRARPLDVALAVRDLVEVDR